MLTCPTLGTVVYTCCSGRAELLVSVSALSCRSKGLPGCLGPVPVPVTVGRVLGNPTQVVHIVLTWVGPVEPPARLRGFMYAWLARHNPGQSVTCVAPH